jgi:hypothetical protein
VRILTQRKTSIRNEKDTPEGPAETHLGLLPLLLLKANGINKIPSWRSRSMKDQELFLRKMKALSMIKAELMKIGKDPDIIEMILMREYDSGRGTISGKMLEVDLDDPEGLKELMKEVRKKL